MLIMVFTYKSTNIEIAGINFLKSKLVLISQVQQREKTQCWGNLMILRVFLVNCLKRRFLLVNLLLDLPFCLHNRHHLPANIDFFSHLLRIFQMILEHVPILFEKSAFSSE